MRVIVIGLGVQGHKRREFAGSDYMGCVDPINPDADFRDVRNVPLDTYDAALCCIPDEPKESILEYLLSAGKHVLVEKPLWVGDSAAIGRLQAIAQANGVVCYTAYNHRFEPHFVSMRELIVSGELGEIYSCRMFYGNGTARLVRESDWRDQGAGVLPDLGSHLLDTLVYWFGPMGDVFSVTSCNRFENAAPDHVVVSANARRPRIELEMTLLSWRNHFTCDIYAERGSAHIASLCKWGPSSFTHYQRLLPAGRPPERTQVLTQSDPTWAAEYRHFKQLSESASKTDLEQDRWLLESLDLLGVEALAMAETIAETTT